MWSVRTTLMAITVAVLVLMCGKVRTAAADDFFSSSPGPLSGSHGSLDAAGHCNDCHVDDSRALSNDKCLSCHDHQNLRERISGGKGFHASGMVKGKKCESCHLEHKGRGYDIMGWRSISGGEKSFNHQLTGWPLNGKHAATDCGSCHTARNGQGLRTYMGQDKLCGACHKKDQPHGFDRKEMLACDRCHGESVWKPAKSNLDFDHNDRADAKMGLFGSHEDVACSKCHAKSLFNLPAAKPDGCGNSGCHQSPHDGHIFGTKDCDWCHSPTFRTMKQFKFDHDERTKFDLGASHAKLDCYLCHTKAIGTGKPISACETCHAKDSKHGDRFKEFGSPPACGTCHPSANWRPSVFNHDSRTGFKLTGKHAAIDCRKCHRGSGPANFERFDKSIAQGNCRGCHQHESVHDKKFESSQCLGCHTGPGKITVKREDMIRIYHGPKSRFPLVKAHRSVSCGECHLEGKFDGTPMECGVRCHQDSLHKGSLGQECSRCHAPGTWDALRFEHNEDTDFPLIGQHKLNRCEDCHTAKRTFTGTPRNCSAVGCHADDDAHRGRLGTHCERCHVETGDNLFNHNTMSRFPLDGKHLDVRCADCHPSVTFKPRPTTCFGCHPEPNAHRGMYGTDCAQCHTTKTFEDIRPLHDVGDFALVGMHDNLACERCHRGNRPLSGTGNLCINCHRQDDVHSNSLSPRCGECHTQWSFAPARFDHSRVGCNITGLHRTIPCFDCHKNGNFGALAPTCASCHRDEAQRKGDANHLTATACATCHNPNSWLPAQGAAVFGRESICR